jgi:hypothetical protein
LVAGFETVTRANEYFIEMMDLASWQSPAIYGSERARLG